MTADVETVLELLRKRGIHTDEFRTHDFTGVPLSGEESLADWFAHQIEMQGEAVNAMSAKLRSTQLL